MLIWDSFSSKYHFDPIIHSSWLQCFLFSSVYVLMLVYFFNCKTYFLLPIYLYFMFVFGWFHLFTYLLSTFSMFSIFCWDALMFSPFPSYLYLVKHSFSILYANFHEGSFMIPSIVLTDGSHVSQCKNLFMFVLYFNCRLIFKLRLVLRRN